MCRDISQPWRQRHACGEGSASWSGASLRALPATGTAQEGSGRGLGRGEAVGMQVVAVGEESVAALVMAVAGKKEEEAAAYL